MSWGPRFNSFNVGLIKALPETLTIDRNRKYDKGATEQALRAR